MLTGYRRRRETMKYSHFITKLLDFGAGLYDPLFRLTVDEQKFREKLVELEHLEGKERVLDIGCGTGTLDLMIVEILNEGFVCGIDISPKMISAAKKKAERNGCEIGYRVGSSTELPYNSNEFDVVFTSLVYHHLDYEGKRRTLHEIHRVLKQNGKYISAEFGGFPGDPFHRLIIRFTGSSGILHGMYPPELIEEVGFQVLSEIKGPLLAGHHQITYRLLGRKS